MLSSCCCCCCCVQHNSDLTSSPSRRGESSLNNSHVSSLWVTTLLSTKSPLILFGASWWCHHNKAGAGGVLQGTGQAQQPRKWPVTVTGWLVKNHLDHPLRPHELSGSPRALQDPPTSYKHHSLLAISIFQSHFRRTESMFPHQKKKGKMALNPFPL